jgi:methylenetetrahydrofolate dehydrogenase (NADP+)/methenyltetrahydrofolate cyclohydrolase
MKIIDGKALSMRLRQEMKEKIQSMPICPGLAVVIVGSDPASQIYVRNKVKACNEVGVQSFVYELPETVPQKQIEDLLDALAEDAKIHGILLQLPLPKQFDGEKAMSHIPVCKDVDGFSAENLGMLMLHKERVVACTPLGIMKILEAEKVDLQGKHAVVLGRSATVGKPIAALLLNANATVTICHSKTHNLKEICKTADILIASVGQPNFVREDMVKEGAVVIDVGINRDENGKLCGDVDFENVKEKTSLITPVPGGVGPMTITMLLYNTCLLAEQSIKE